MGDLEFLPVGAQEATDGRVLVVGNGVGGHTLARNRQFFLATQNFARDHPNLPHTRDAQVDATDHWTEQHWDNMIGLLASSMGLTAPVVARAVCRMGFGVRPLTPDVVADQRKIADTFFDLRLIPQKLNVAIAVWSART